VVIMTGQGDLAMVAGHAVGMVDLRGLLPATHGAHGACGRLGEPHQIVPVGQRSWTRLSSPTLGALMAGLTRDL
jgi:hypothetical protein